MQRGSRLLGLMLVFLAIASAFGAEAWSASRNPVGRSSFHQRDAAQPQRVVVRHHVSSVGQGTFRGAGRRSYPFLSRSVHLVRAPSAAVSRRELARSLAHVRAFGIPHPENRQRAEASRLRYGHLEPAQAVAVDRRAFAPIFHAPGLSVLGSGAGARFSLVRRLSGRSAVIRNRQGRRSVVQASVPVFDATDQQGSTAPLNLGLVTTADGYGPSSALAPVSIPNMSNGPLTFPDLGMSVQFADAAVSGEQQGDTVLYPDIDGAAGNTDAVAQPTTSGAEISWILRSALSADTYTLTLNLPAGWNLQSDPDGGVSVHSGTGTIEAIVMRPMALDALDHEVPTRLSILGPNRIIVSVNPTAGTYTYPIKLDPQVIENTYTGEYQGTTPWWQDGYWQTYLTGGFTEDNSNGDYEEFYGSTQADYQNNDGGVYFAPEPSGAWAFETVAENIYNYTYPTNGGGYVGEMAGIFDSNEGAGLFKNEDTDQSIGVAGAYWATPEDDDPYQQFCVDTNCDSNSPYPGDTVVVPGENVFQGNGGYTSSTPVVASDAVYVYETDDVSPSAYGPSNSVPTNTWFNPKTSGEGTDAWSSTWIDQDGSSQGLGLSSIAITGPGTTAASDSFPFNCGGNIGPCPLDEEVGASLNLSDLSEGVNTYTVTATSITGLQSSYTMQFDVDETPPTASVSCAGGGQYTTSDTCTITGSDPPDRSDGAAGSGLASLQYETNSGQGWSGPTTTSNGGQVAIQGTGAVQVRAIATDNAGNTFTSPSTTIRIDSTPPSVALSGSLYSASTGGQTVSGGSYELDMDATESQSGVGSIALTVDNSVGTQVGSQTFQGQCSSSGSPSGCATSEDATYDFDAALYPPGTYTFNVTATSWAGATSSPQSFSVTTSPANPLGSSQSQAQNGLLGLESFYDYRTTQTGAGSSLNVNLGTGNGVWDWTPIVDAGQGLASFVQLTYNSQARVSDLDVDGTSATDDGYDQAGTGFSVGIDGLTRLNEPLDLSQLSQGAISFTDIDGTSHTFIKNSAGDWIAPPGVFLHLRQWQSYSPSNPSSWAKAWAITRPDGATFFFDPLGYETSIEDRTGNTITFNNDLVLPADQPAGPGGQTICQGTVANALANDADQLATAGCEEQVQSVTDQGGRSITVAYEMSGNATGKIATITDHAGHQLTFGYSSDGERLDSLSYASTRTFQFGWGGSNDAYTPGSVLSSIDPSLSDVNAAVFPEHLTSIEDPDGNTTSLSYVAQPASGSDPCPVGQTSSSLSSPVASLLGVEPVCVASVTARDGGVTSYSYSSSANSSGTASHTATVTGPVKDAYGDQEVWTDITDEYFRPVEQIDPLGRETTTSWNDVGAKVPSACSNAPNAPSSEPGNTMASQTVGLLAPTITTTPAQTAAPAQTNDCYDDDGDVTEQQGPFNPSSSESPTFRDTKTTYQLSAGPSFLQAPSGADSGGSFVSDETAHSVSSAAGTETTSYSYDPTDPDDGLVTAVTDPDGQKWSTSYDQGLGGEPSSSSSASTDQGGGLIQSETDPDGNTTTYGDYDANGLAGQVTLPDQSSPSFYDYDADGNLLAKADPRGGAITDPNAPSDGASLQPYVTYYSYDAVGDLLSTLNPQNMDAGIWDVDSSSYDADGDVTQTVDGSQQSGSGSSLASGTTTQFAYTPMNDVQSKSVQGVPSTEQSPGSSAQTTSYCYDLNGDVSFETLPAGQPNNSTYTCASGQVAPANHAVQYYLDGDGENLAQVQLSDTPGSQDQITSYAYNARGDQTAESDPADNSGDSWQAAVANVPTATPSMAGAWDTATVYDSADDAIENITNPGITTPAGAGQLYVQRSQYDAAGNLLATESAKEADADNSTSAQSLSPSTGEFAFVGQANMTSYSYDERNLLLTSTNPDGDETAYGRSPNGQVCWTLSPRGVAADGANVPSSTDCSSSTQTANYTTGYDYTPQGWLSSISLPRAAGEYSYGAEPMTVSYSRDVVGDPTQIVDPRGTTITNTFYADGDLQTTTAPWWWTDDPSGSGQSLDPNDGSMGQLSAQTPSEGQISEKPLSELYEENAKSDDASAPLPSDGISGNLGDVPAQPLAGIVPDAGNTEFSYTGQGWLSGVTDGIGDSGGTFTPSEAATTSLGYDPDGNLLTESQPGPDGTASTTTYTYDPDGNTLSLSTPSRTTLAAGDLTPGALKGGEGTSVTPTTTYAYDGLDRLVSETAPGASTSASQSPSSQTTEYCYYTDPTSQSPSAGTGDSDGCPAQSTSGTPMTVSEPSGDAVSVAQRVLEINPDDNASTNDYDELGNTVQSTDPLGDKTVYGYDELGDQISLTRPGGNTAAEPTTAGQAPYTTTSTYDQAGLLTQSTDGSGNTTTYSYDQDGNLTQQDSPGAAGAAAQSAEPEVTDYAYNGRDLLWKTTTGLNADNSAGSDTRTTVTETDGDGNVIRTVNAAGAGTGALADPYYAYPDDYAASGQSTSSDPDANIDATINVYDANNELSASYLPWGCDLTSNTASDRECAPSAITDTRRWMVSYGRTTDDSADEAGDWITSVSQAYDWTQSSPQVDSTTYTYDPNGWIQSAATPQLADNTNTPSASTPSNGTEQTTSYDYDLAGDETKQAIAASSPSGALTRSTYRSWWPDGQPQVMDATGQGGSERTNDYLFNPTGELSGISGVTTASAGGSSTSASDQVCYDAASRPTDVQETVPGVQGQGATQTYDTVFAYDSDGNVIDRADNGADVSFSCPASGQDPSFPLSEYNAGQTSAFSYNNLDQQTNESISSNAGDPPAQENRTFTSTYWPSGQIDTQTRQIDTGSAPAPVSESWYYTPSGQVAEDVRSSGTGTGSASPAYDQDFSYDSDDNTSEDESGTHVYNALNQEVEWTRGGPDTLDPGGTSTYTLNGDGALLQEVDNLSFTNAPVPSSDLGSPTLPGESATEDATEEIVTRHCSDTTASTATGMAASQAAAQPMCSLDAGRAENVQTTSTISNGSITLTAAGAGVVPQSFANTNKTVTQLDCYDAFSELTEVVQAPDSCKSPSPNAATTSTYTYSDLGLEVGQIVPDPTPSNASQTLDDTYQYDALGRRSQKTEQTSSASSPTTSDYAYLGLSLNAVTQDQSSSPSGTNGSGSETTTNTYDYDAAENPVGVNITTDGTPTYYTYAKDPNGTVQGLENANGIIAEDDSYHYTPYGEPELSASEDTYPLGQSTTQNTLTADAQANEIQYDGFIYNAGGSPDPATNDNGEITAPALPNADSDTLPARNYLPGQSMWQSPDTFEASNADQGLAARPVSQDPYTFVAGNPTSNIEVDGHYINGQNGHEAVSQRVGNTVMTYVTSGSGRGQETSSYDPVPPMAAYTPYSPPSTGSSGQSMADSIAQGKTQLQALEDEIKNLLKQPHITAIPEDDLTTLTDDYPIPNVLSGINADPITEPLSGTLITTPGPRDDGPAGGGYTIPDNPGLTALEANDGEGAQNGVPGVSQGSGDAYDNPDRNPAQDKSLTPRDIQTLQDNGFDLHGGEKIGGSGSDLYKDGEGNVYEKPKGGAGPGEPIGANLNTLRGQ